MFSFFKKKISQVLHAMQDAPPAAEQEPTLDAPQQPAQIAEGAAEAAVAPAAHLQTETATEPTQEPTPPQQAAGQAEALPTQPETGAAWQAEPVAPAMPVQAAQAQPVQAVQPAAPEQPSPAKSDEAGQATAHATPAAPVAEAHVAEPAPAPIPEPALEAAPEPNTEPTPSAPAPDRSDWLGRLKAGLKKTGSNISAAFGVSQVDESLYEELEAALLMADAGVQATNFLLADLRQRVRAARASEPVQVRALLADAIADLLQPLQKPLVIGEHTPTVIMVAGVNGAGKTTSIGKLTKHLSQAGQGVLLAAADTFRAAAREQLAVWADRNMVEIVSSAGGDPAALSFDAVAAGKARGRDVVLVDTAGRLPTQIHLMDELKKIRRTINKADATAPHEVLLVIDGNTGQNALAQVKAFDDALQLTGLIVTKLDGTAKGGVLCAIARERPVPVYFVGVGEKLEDLQTFRAREFAEALLGG